MIFFWAFCCFNTCKIFLGLQNVYKLKNCLLESEKYSAWNDLKRILGNKKNVQHFSMFPYNMTLQECARYCAAIAVIAKNLVLAKFSKKIKQFFWDRIHFRPFWAGSILDSIAMLSRARDFFYKVPTCRQPKCSAVQCSARRHVGASARWRVGTSRTSYADSSTFPLFARPRVGPTGAFVTSLLFACLLVNN